MYLPNFMKNWCIIFLLSTAFLTATISSSFTQFSYCVGLIIIIISHVSKYCGWFYPHNILKKIFWTISYNSAYIILKLSYVYRFQFKFTARIIHWILHCHVELNFHIMTFSYNILSQFLITIYHTISEKE